MTNLVSNFTPYNPRATQMMQGMAHSMWMNGSPAALAAKQSYGATIGMVARQATILSFINTFRLLAVIFAVLIPLILVMKKPEKPSGPVAAH
jgi:MFS transporter, DHA2 family, multidrug resistance protein